MITFALPAHWVYLRKQFNNDPKQYVFDDDDDVGNAVF